MPVARSFILTLLVSGLACSSNGSLKELNNGMGSRPGFMLPDTGGTTGAGGSTPGVGENPGVGGAGAAPASGNGGNAGTGGGAGAENAGGSAPPAEMPPASMPDAAANGKFINTVFVVVEAGANWSDIAQEMPYLRDLVRTGAHSEQYYNPPSVHPGEPNYIWMETGARMGITSDDDPGTNLLRGANHLSKLLDAAGVSWTSYQEDIAPGTCPVVSQGAYTASHNPFVFFDDVVGDPPSPSSAACIAHHKPFAQFLTDLKAGTVARYNFITPNLQHDSQDGSVIGADDWLKANIDPIINPQSPYHNPEVWAHAAVFVVWEAGDEPNDGPIGMVIASPFARAGYQDTTSPSPYSYTHSSLLRTVQEIFGVENTPLGEAASARNLSEFFSRYP
jgi:hypothetical protein